LIFARSSRSTYLLAAGAGAVAGGLFGFAGWLLVTDSAWAALPPAMVGAVALAVVARMVRRIRSWPPSRLGFFRDRLVLVQGPVELQAAWDKVEGATLARQVDSSPLDWPEISLSDRLTVRLAASRSFSFRPATFGVDPLACRDLVLRLRDDGQLRARLPEFDSELDLSTRPLHTGDLIRPQL
jgi:hypothetical protein